jgi:hypothetical protein
VSSPGSAPGPEALAAFLTKCYDADFFAKHMLGMDLHKGQSQWMRESHRRINCLVPGNRFGKSTIIGVKHLHKAFTKAGFTPFRKDQHWGNFPYSTISVSHSADQAEIVYGMAKQMARYPAFAPFVKRVYATPFPTIVLVNGSSITCRSAHDNGRYIDGHRYDYVSIDEAGWIAELKRLINGVILMRLSGGGELDLLGTPKGISQEGLYFYASRGMRGVEDYYTQRGSTFDNPFLPEKEIRERMKLLEQADPRVRDQVIYGAFVSTEGLAFTQDQLDNAFDATLPAHVDYDDSHRYVQAWDLGRKTDWTVGVTLDVTSPPYHMVDFVRLNKVPWETIYGLIDEKSKEYKVRLPRIDATGPQGDVIEEELQKRGIFVDAFKVSTGAIKTDLINTLQTALDYGRRTLSFTVVPDESGYPMDVPVLELPGDGDWGLLRMPPIPQIVDEFGIYQFEDRKLVQDCVQAVALAVHSVFDGSILFEPISGDIYGSR